MKIGITKNKGEDKKRFVYSVWYRNSDGKLRHCDVTEKVSIQEIIDNYSSIEAKIKLNSDFEQTSEETGLETFMEEI